MTAIKHEILSAQVSADVLQPEVPSEPLRIHPATKLAEYSKYEKQCRSVLGDTGALLFFCYAALRPKWTMSKLVRWTQMLRDSINDGKEELRPARTNAKGTVLLSRNTKIEKPQVSVWKKYSPVVAEFPCLNSIGWNYRILNIQVFGKNNQNGIWLGNLICILELRTGTFFHHLISESKSFKLSEQQVFYALAKADEKMALHPDAHMYAQHIRQVFIPKYSSCLEGGVFLSNASKVYDNVFGLFEGNKNSSKSILIEFASKKEFIVFGHWRAQAYSQSIAPFCVDVKAGLILGQVDEKYKNNSGDSVKLKNSIDTGQHLKNAIYRISQCMSKRLKENSVEVDSDLVSLNSLVAHDRLDIARYDKKH